MQESVDKAVTIARDALEMELCKKMSHLMPSTSWNLSLNLKPNIESSSLLSRLSTISEERK